MERDGGSLCFIPVEISRFLVGVEEEVINEFALFLTDPVIINYGCVGVFGIIPE
jgi:hypothetical protein